MTAKEMFESMGYFSREDTQSVKYLIDDEDTSFLFEFHKHLETIFLTDKKSMQSVEVTVDEIKAMYAQCKELGWLE